MNLQSLTIIFVIIFLPIILISTYYIQREVDTITLQTSYDSKLIDATTDAVSAFEINTANEDLSSVSDSLRSIIEASNNVFTTTMATNLGMSGASKSKILPYIPAIVYTLYDGYYIYSPTKQPKVLTDPDGVYVKVGDNCVAQNSKGEIFYDYDYNLVDTTPDKTTLKPGKVRDNDYGKILYFAADSEGKINPGQKVSCVTNPDYAYRTTSYILKSFIPYSMQYEWDVAGEKNNVTINYTLDNYITVYGTIGGVYYSKSGYLIDFNRISEITNIDLNQYSMDEIDDLVKNNDNISLKVDGQILLSSNTNSATSEHYTGVELSDNKSAVAYYLKAYMFSKWVNDNLKGIDPSDDILDNFKNLQEGFSIKQSGKNLEDEAKLFWDYTEDSIFLTNGNWNIENSNSNFYEHKRKVIKNSIQYSLNQAMATYNQGQGDEHYQMPILSEPEWDKLLSNVSVLSFMQGLPCGLKTYNNYALVTSSNNEIMANIDDIYYVPVEVNADILDNDFDATDLINGKMGVLNSNEKNMLEKLGYSLDNIELPTAHTLDCNSLPKGGVLYYESFPSKELKYDKEYNPNTKDYEYDHVCSTCYNCIVNANYDKSDYSIFKEIDAKNIIDRTNDEKTLYANLQNSTDIKNLKKAELISIGKIRNNTYKSSAVITNYGLEIENLNTKFDNFSQKPEKFENAYEVQVTIDTSELNRSTKYMHIGQDIVAYTTGSAKPQTLVFKNSSLWGIQDVFTYNNKNFEALEQYKLYTDENNIQILSITYKYK